MSGFFSAVFVISTIVVVITLIIALVAFLRKNPHRKYLKIAGISAIIGITSLVCSMATQTPEERAAQQQRAAERQAEKDRLAAEKQAQKEKAAEEKDAIRAQENAEKKQKEERNLQEKEKAAADAAAQKLYDDQAEYEEWIRTNATIGKSPGLGDRVSAFAKKHNLTNDNNVIKVYDDGHFSATILDGRIVNLDIDHTEGHKMDSIVTDLLPADGVEISSSVDNSDALLSKHISVGHSDILDIAVPSSGGYYTRVDIYDSKSGNYIHTVIATGEHSY